MDYLNGWVMFGIALIIVIAIGDEMYFRVERRRQHKVNVERERANSRENLPEYIDEDDLCVIDNDVDECVYEGSPADVYDWLLRSRGAGSYDVYNRGTVKKVTSSQFLAKFVD